MMCDWHNLKKKSQDFKSLKLDGWESKSLSYGEKNLSSP